MDKIAFIIGETFVYWNSIFLMLASAMAICVFLMLYLREEKSGISAALLVPISVAGSVVISRVIHWYCQSDAYESLADALTTFTGGGYALMGVFAGCALTAAVLRLLRIVRNLPMTFDCMAIAGAAGIAVGRLACLYTPADRGPVMEDLQMLPFAHPVSNAVTGAEEWRLATFMLQAIVAGLLFVSLLIFYLVGQRGEDRKLRDGDTACLFLLAYGASQIVLDSTRYDSLFLRSNGFVSIVQILGAAALVGAAVWFSVRMVKARGFRWWQIVLWTLLLGLVSLGGFMEYWVQRHGDQAVFSYSIMSGCLGVAVILVCGIRALAVTVEQKWALVESYKS